MLHAPFTADRLLLQNTTRDKKLLIHLLCEAVIRAPGVPDSLSPEELEAEASLRDAEGASVRVGNKLVCLHLRRPDVEAVRMSLATLTTPMMWTDGETAQVVVLLAAPRDRPVQSLRVFSQLERLMADPAAEAWLESATDPGALAPWLDARLREDDGVLTARDLMRPSMGRATPDMPLPVLCKAMARHGFDAVGITDSDRRLVGLVTADDLFSIGMPDFFHQLESVSFLADFDPFERYFDKEHRLTAGDVMRKDPCVVGPDATILEVVFLLAVKKKPKVFVVEDDRLIGVIDRIRVIAQILEP